MRNSRSVAVAGLALAALLAACRPPPPPPPPPPGPMTLGWTNTGATGPVAADITETPNLVWSMGGGTLHGIDASTGGQVVSHVVGLDGSQHFPTPVVVNNWVVVEKSNHRVAGFPTPANSSGLEWTSAVLDGEVQSRPVVVGTTVVVATENDSLYGLNLADGTIQWGPTHFGTPEPKSEFQSYGSVQSYCGNIDPLGVTSNPVYDAVTNRVFAVGERTTGSVSPHPPEHVMVGVDPSTGNVTLPAANVDVSAMGGADGHGVARHQQRAGLILANSKVYVGYGGLVGDCGEYHGFVVAANTTDGQVVGSLEVTSNSNAGAVWATAGGTVDGSGNVYVATGNGQGSPGSGTDYSDAVVKVTPSLSGPTTAPADYFQPPEWRSDNNADADLGSMAPVVVENGSQLFIIGKQHNAFLLNISALGGSNHMTPFARLDNACTGEAFGQNAAIGKSAYIACSSGLQQVHLP